MDTLTVSLVTIMIPGVIVALIYDTYTQHKQWDTFRYILMSVVFGIITYIFMQAAIIVYQFVQGVSDTKSINWFFLSVWSITNNDKLKINPIEVFFGGLLSIPLGLLIVYISTRRTFHEFLLRKGISNKYGDDNAFIRSVEIMHRRTKSCYVLLQESNLLVHGTISLYNESDKTQELGLLNATIMNSETGDVLFMTNFIYLSKDYGKIVVFENYIEVDNDESEESKVRS